MTHQPDFASVSDSALDDLRDKVLGGDFFPTGGGQRRFDDKQMIRAYQISGGELGDPLAEALLAEIQRRNLDL